MPPDLWLIGTVFAALFGACIGSFLNVCIYRIPLDLSVATPRSHCFSCGKLIPWYHNLPVLSYFLLRGRCHACKATFSFRYAFVELLTACLFVLVCVAYPPMNAEPILGIVRLPSLAAIPVVWVFISGLILGTFVDFDHYIIPDSVTIGGTAAGVVLSAVVPELQGADVWWRGLANSALGAVVGFAVLYAIMLLGKAAFGRKRVTLEAPTVLSFVAQDAAGPALRLGDDVTPWDELFYRPSDRWRIECSSAALGERQWSNITVVLRAQSLEIEGQRHPRTEAAAFTAQVVAYTYPREAMGFGDVKLMAALGAFLGWKAVLFAVIASSLFGTIVGVALMAMGKRQLGSKLPFGPYIALAGIVWVFWGPKLVAGYLNLFLPLASLS